MASHPERNAGRKRRGPPVSPAPGGPGKPRFQATSGDWIWGVHAVEAALSNPARPAPRRLLATPDRARELERRFGALKRLELTDPAGLARLLPAGAAHQGLALEGPEPEPVDLDDFAPEPGAVLLMLDQVTDAGNVGAILRTAAAFGARGVILQERRAPRLSGALAKAAAGAVDIVPVARVVNLSRALERLSDLGWRAVGLDGTAKQDLSEVLDGTPVVLVLGSEGEGVRRLVAEHCDEAARIPMPGGFESLNVAAAAAVALYEAARPRR
ncbi:MAG: 23S rRNA (guanosine(2251)-2'-O)-methyltransferase RlmB [Alphaproteobacteria bacterium]